MGVRCDHKAPARHAILIGSVSWRIVGVQCHHLDINRANSFSLFIILMKFILLLSAASTVIAMSPEQSCTSVSDCESGMMCRPNRPNRPKEGKWHKKGAYPLGVPGQSSAYGHHGKHPQSDPSKLAKWAAICAKPGANCVCKKPRGPKMTQSLGGSYPTPIVTATSNVIATETAAPGSFTKSKDTSSNLTGSSALKVENVLAFVVSGLSILLVL